MKTRRSKPRKTLPKYHFTRGKRTWSQKFSDAFSGLHQSIFQQSSFHVHIPAAILVLATAGYLGTLDTVRWSILILCIVLVIGAEMFNTALEMLARAVTTSYNPHIGKALDIASGTVLTLSFGAGIVGTILFVEAFLQRFGQRFGFF